MTRYSTHAKISFTKSLFRIIGFLMLKYSIPIAAFILIAAEIIGVAEEIYE